MRSLKKSALLDLYVKMGETTSLDSYRICSNHSGGLGPKQRGRFQESGRFYNVTRSQRPNPTARFYKAINIGFPNAYDRAHAV